MEFFNNFLPYLFSIYKVLNDLAPASFNSLFSCYTLPTNPEYQLHLKKKQSGDMMQNG